MVEKEKKRKIRKDGEEKVERGRKERLGEQGKCKSGKKFFKKQEVTEHAFLLFLQMAAAIGLRGTPSAYQIRFKGCKGVVAIDPTLDGNQMVIRPSMEKFQSNHGGIEVMRTSQASKFVFCKTLDLILQKKSCKKIALPP